MPYVYISVIVSQHRARRGNRRVKAGDLKQIQSGTELLDILQDAVDPDSMEVSAISVYALTVIVLPV